MTCFLLPTTHLTSPLVMTIEQCLKLGVCNTKKRGDLSLSLVLCLQMNTCLQGPTGEGSDLSGFMTSGDLQDTPVTVRKEHETLTISYSALTLTISENFLLYFFCGNNNILLEQNLKSKRSSNCPLYIPGRVYPHSPYITIVPQCLSPRPNWDPPLSPPSKIVDYVVSNNFCFSSSFSP
jgi:hypothetical protein